MAGHQVGQRFVWRAAALALGPGQETVEIVIRFDPARDPPARIVQAMVTAMERAPDPRYPGPRGGDHPWRPGRLSAGALRPGLAWWRRWP